MRHDLVSDALSIINNAEMVGKTSCEVPKSKLIENILKVIKATGYIKDFKSNERTIIVELIGKINKIKSVKPRFSIKKDEYEKWETRYLPAADIGILVVSTPKGVINQHDAVKKGLGGKLIAFVY